MNPAARLTIALAWLCAFVPAPRLLAEDIAHLRQRQLSQQQARELVVELVSGVLDVQLRRLEENGLQRLPLYADVRSMKNNLDSLVDSELPEVIRLFQGAQSAAADERERIVGQARIKIRQIVVALMAERQKLGRRRQIARLAADARQLIDLQSRALAATESVAQIPASQREGALLRAIQDQQDIHAFFLQFIAAMREVGNWGGQPAAAASDGLRIVRTAQLESELRGVAGHLVASEYETAAERQRGVLDGLQALLDRLEESQGLFDADRAAALELVRTLIERQVAIRDDTRGQDRAENVPGTVAKPSSPRALDSLVDRQVQVHKDLGGLAPALQRFPATGPLLNQAKAAAYEASGLLFDDRREPAAAAQQTVVQSLAQIERELENSIDRELADKSADELAADVERLERVNQTLDASVALQEALIAAADGPPAAALDRQTAVRDLLGQLDEIRLLPRTVTASLENAKDTVTRSQEALVRSQSAGGGPPRRELQEARTAIRQAHSEVASQLADVRRRHLAVVVGELARAAEALERAAAREREIASEAGLNAEAKSDTRSSIESQMQIAIVADDIRKGVARTATDVSQRLEQLMPAILRVQQQLARRDESLADDEMKTIGRETALAAEQAAIQLEQTASELRRMQGTSSMRLAQLARQQLTEVRDARAPVEQQAGDTEQFSESAELTSLDAALDRVRQAQSFQLRAAGRAEAAAARDLLLRVEGLRGRQDMAEQAAGEIASGKANSTLDAATLEQQVSEEAARLAAEAGEFLAATLQQVSRDAAAAAKETFAGRAAHARTSHDAVRQGLRHAAVVSQQLATKAEQVPAGAADRAAQQQVAALAEEARQLVAASETSAVELLQQLGQLANDAAQAIRDGATGRREASQAAAAGILGQVEQSAVAAIARREQTLREKLSRQIARIDALTPAVARVDSAATAALQQARRAARRVEAGESSPRIASDEFRQGVELANASLAARLARIERDRSIAETIGSLAQQQQQARDDITKWATALAELRRQQSPKAAQEPDADADSALDPHQLEAAQALKQATRQFADAQKATGQGAAEISGQQEVANLDIRHGLQTASGLARVAAGDKAQQSEPGAADESPTAKTDAAGDAPPGGDHRDASESATAGEDGDSTSQSGEADSRNPPENQSGAGQQGSGSGRGGSPQSQPQANPDLGTGLVPESPEFTAEQIAGQQAMQEAANALAQAGGADARQRSAGEAADESSSEPGNDAAAATAGGTSAGANAADDSQSDPDAIPRPAMPAAQAGSENEIVIPQELRFQRDPWFAKLPPALRQAIQSRSRRPVPPGYEQRLRRYFESID